MERSGISIVEIENTPVVALTLDVVKVTRCVTAMIIVRTNKQNPINTIKSASIESGLASRLSRINRKAPIARRPIGNPKTIDGTLDLSNVFIVFNASEPDNGNDHRAAAIDLQAEKAARPAAPCASYCYPAWQCLKFLSYSEGKLALILSLPGRTFRRAHHRF